MTKIIPFFSSYVDKSSTKLVVDTLKSTFLSEGKKVAEFESILESFGINNPVAVNSGTSALHLALILAGVGPGDEVVVPAQTFLASALAIKYVGAKPIFADCNYFDGNISIESIRSKISNKTKAIMPVHWGGYPCDMTAIKKIALENGLVVVEDAAHALGATYKNKSIGALSEFTCFSFQAIKHVTTADGGLVATRLKKDYIRAKKLRWFGIDRDNSKPSELGERQFQIDEVGYKYHMNDFSASLGIANLMNFAKRLERRRHIANQYSKAFKDIDGITLFDYKKNRLSSYWIFGMHIEDRLSFIRALKSRGISTSVVHQRIDRYSVFGGLTKNLVNQEHFDETQIHIPMHDDLTDANVMQIISAVKKGW